MISDYDSNQWAITFGEKVAVLKSLSFGFCWNVKVSLFSKLLKNLNKKEIVDLQYTPCKCVKKNTTNCGSKFGSTSTREIHISHSRQCCQNSCRLNNETELSGKRSFSEDENKRLCIFSKVRGYVTVFMKHVLYFAKSTVENCL